MMFSSPVLRLSTSSLDASLLLRVGFLRHHKHQLQHPSLLSPPPTTPRIAPIMSPLSPKRRRLHQTPASLAREISPPSSNHRDTPASPTTKAASPLRPSTNYKRVFLNEAVQPPIESNPENHGFNHTSPEPFSESTSLPSPFHLTTIQGLPAFENQDTVGIEDILGEVMLREVWLFNYMHDIHWVMKQFDDDIRAHVKVVFVHGNWKREDRGRRQMEEATKEYPNVSLVAAYMPEAFGTHHSKIIVLFRRDDLAQVVIQTANMIPFDWENMTQAAWISPLLPLEPHSAPKSKVGSQFKLDIIEYLNFYGNFRLKDLLQQLHKHTFDSVRAVFIGSVPGKHKVSDAKWGWLKLRKALSVIPSSASEKATPKVFAQCSSIATLGQNDTWLTPVLLSALSASATKGGKKPQFGIVFPTVQEIRDSLNGYASGMSIHLRSTSPTQQKQLAYLKPKLYHWSSPLPEFSAGRNRAAPHIKTYIRFSNEPKDGDADIDWALLTSANLSTQAWGAAEKDGTVRICSYEAGVLVFPGLWGESAKMKPVFKKDARNEGGVVALRMPYSLPVQVYNQEDEAWSPEKEHKGTDWMGRTWEA